MRGEIEDRICLRRVTVVMKNCGRELNIVPAIG